MEHKNSENETPNTAPVGVDGWTSAGPKNAQLVYFLYLSAIVLGITGIIGLVFAYLNRDKADEVSASHYTYQIRGFWIWLIAALVCFILSFILIGLLGYLLIFIWWLVRSIKGLILISKNEPHPNPNTLLF